VCIVLRVTWAHHENRLSLDFPSGLQSRVIIERAHIVAKDIELDGRWKDLSSHHNDFGSEASSFFLQTIVVIITLIVKMKWCHMLTIEVTVMIA
jgi:hypothetical protein